MPTPTSGSAITHLQRGESSGGTGLGPIVMACDESYAMPLATALRSLVEANTRWWPLEIVVITDEFSEAGRQKVLGSLPEGSVHIRWAVVDLQSFQQFSTMEYISKMTYARLLIPRVFPDTVKKVLYLDADILVLDNLARLWHTDLGGRVIAAVLDGVDAQIKAGSPLVRGVPRVAGYFNAGVLLIDLERWRAERISEKALDYLQRHPRTLFMDQDGLNVACDGRWTALEGRWNFIGASGRDPRIADLDPAHRPAIVHFATSKKPWVAARRNVNAAFYDTFRSRTRFARTSVDKLLDVARRSWSDLKRTVKQLEAFRVIQTQIGPVLDEN